jgi:hypothetical protein
MLPKQKVWTTEWLPTIRGDILELEFQCRHCAPVTALTSNQTAEECRAAVWPGMHESPHVKSVSEAGAHTMSSRPCTAPGLAVRYLETGGPQRHTWDAFDRARVVEETSLREPTPVSTKPEQALHSLQGTRASFSRFHQSSMFPFTHTCL